MKKTILSIALLIFLVTLHAGDLLIFKFSRSSTVFGWDHLGKGWLTEMVTNFEGDFLMIGAGPMLDVGPVSFSAPLLLSLKEGGGVEKEVTLCPRVDFEKKNFLFQTWHDLVCSGEVQWSSDNKLLFVGNKIDIGVNLLSSEGEISSIGLIARAPISNTISVETFVDTEVVSWIKFKVFIP